MAKLLQDGQAEALRSRFRLLLASQSPRRRELLQLLGLPFDVTTPSFAEDLDQSRLSPEEYVLATAVGKCEAVCATLPPARPDGRADVVICADTVIAHEGHILEKPEDAAAARRMLASMSGRSHEVLTAVVVHICGRPAPKSFVERTEVTFYDLSPAEVDAYVATGEPFDKAGGYGIQSRGSLLVRGIRGDYFNVVGLPIARLARLLEAELLDGAAAAAAPRASTPAPETSALGDAAPAAAKRRKVVDEGAGVAG